MTAGVKANADGSAAIQVGGSDAIQISAALNTTLVGSLTVAGSSTALYPLVSGTVNAGGTAPFPATGGPTFVDFTGIPSTAKRITVIFNAFSTSGATGYLVQIGSSTISTSGYSGNGVRFASTTFVTIASTAGLLLPINGATQVTYGSVVIYLVSSNAYSMNGMVSDSTVTSTYHGASGITLGGLLDRVRITTVSGTETLDGGLVNIMWE